MKSLLALVAISLAAMALAPTAQAHVAPPRPDFPLCQPAVVGEVCFSPYWPGCNVWIEWTAIPAQPTCLYRSDPVAASAAGPGVQCMDVYTRYDVHTISIVRRDSCAPPEFYQCPTPGAPISSCTPLLELSAAAALPGLQEPDCYHIYRETHVGPVTIVQRSSCHAEVLLCGERDFTQVDPARCPRLVDTAALDAPDLPPMNCYDIYSRWGYGPVYVVMTSSCSGYVEVCGEPVQFRDLSCLLPIRASAGLPEVDTPPIYCMPYERELDLGDVQVVQGGCGSYVRVCGDRVTLDWDGDVGCVADDLVSVSAAAPAEPQCLQVYREYTVGPVHYVSRDSCHSEVDVCGSDAKALPEQDPAALADCAVDSWGILA